ncbi:MAG: hypothetical protein Q8P83_03025 [bacterium]|nr:hypothetical protein [bacterium]
MIMVWKGFKYLHTVKYVSIYFPDLLQKTLSSHLGPEPSSG